MDKGRTDSTCTNEVTYINTILNKNLSLTFEGDAIRRRILDDQSQGQDQGSSVQSGSNLDTPEPPILTIGTFS